MEITENTTEYKVGNYRVQIEKNFLNNRMHVWVFDKEQEISFSCDNITKAKEVCEAVLKVISTLKIETPMGDFTAKELEEKKGDEVPF